VITIQAVCLIWWPGACRC